MATQLTIAERAAKENQLLIVLEVLRCVMLAEKFCAQINGERTMHDAPYLY